MTTTREYLTVAVDDTITLAGPVQVEFLDRAEGYRMGVASAPAGGELKLTGTESIVFARLVTDPAHTAQHLENRLARGLGINQVWLVGCAVCGDVRTEYTTRREPNRLVDEHNRKHGVAA